MRRAAQFASAWLFALAFSALPAAAQCPMCAKSVAAGGTRVIDVIKVGIYIMLVPTLLIFGAIALMIYRRRRHHMAEPSAPPSLPELPSATR